jgi:hypothetical protein
MVTLCFNGRLFEVQDGSFLHISTASDDDPALIQVADPESGAATFYDTTDDSSLSLTGGPQDAPDAFERWLARKEMTFDELWGSLLNEDDEDDECPGGI